MGGFAILTDELLLVISLAPNESEYHHLKVIKLQDGTIHCILGLPFTKIVEWPAFMEDSFQLHGTSNVGTSPFVYTPGIDRIIVLFGVYDDEDREKAFTVVISVKRLLSHITSQISTLVETHDPTVCPPAAPLVSALSGSNTAKVEWTQWGPTTTRWFTGEIKSLAVCGSRLFLTRFDHDDRREISLLCDFNQRVLSRYPYQISEGTIADNTGPAEWWENEGRSLGEHFVTNEWLVDIEPCSDSDDDNEDEYGSPLSTEVRCSLPFRVLVRQFSDLSEAPDDDVLYLGVNELIERSVCTGFLRNPLAISFRPCHLSMN